MDELSEATGLRSGGLYHYIGSKKNLLLQIFSQLMDPLLERAAELERAGGDPEAQLRALVRAWLAHIEGHLDHMAVFAQERHAIEHEPEWEQVRASRDAFEAILARRLAAVGETDRLAHFALLGMVNHTATWFRPGGRLTARQIADGYCDMLLR
jgi:AcrR family transcriptional regulator